MNPDLDYCPFLLPTDDLDFVYELKLYPNPASDMLTVEWNRNEEMNIEFFDISGKRVYGFQDYGNRIYADISMLENGMYFVSINGMVVDKVVVSR